MAELSPLMKAELEERSRWPRPIPVSERLPEEDGNQGCSDEVMVFVLDKVNGEEEPYEHWAMGWLSYAKDGQRIWRLAYGQQWNDEVEVTHWLPMLPNP